jgi:hypothetical protein
MPRALGSMPIESRAGAHSRLPYPEASMRVPFPHGRPAP